MRKTVTNPGPDKPEVEIPTDITPVLSGIKQVTDGNANGIADAGEVLTYTLHFTNTGAGDAKNIVVTDLLDDTEFANSTVTDLVVNGATYNGDITTGINIGTISAGTDAIITFNTTLSDPLPVGNGVLENIATAVDEAGTTIEINKAIPTDAAPILDGTKTVADGNGDGVAEAGETLTYTITYTNIGNIDTTDVIITDLLDDVEFANATVNNLTVNGQTHNGDITKGINVGVLSPSQTAIVTLEVTLADTLLIDDNIIKNTVTANGFEANAEIGVKAVLVTPEPKYEGTKAVTVADGSTVAKAGSTLNYIITYQNVGDASGYNIIIKDQLADTEFAGSIVTNLKVNDIAYDGDITTGIQIAELAPNETVVVTFDVTLASPLPAGDGKLTNIATMNEENPTEVITPTNYQILYNGNGNTSGEVPVDTTSYENGAIATVLDANTLVKDGYTFIGWSLNPEYQVTTNDVQINNEMTLYQAGDTIEMTQDITLYAVWSEEAKQPEQPTPNIPLPTTGRNDSIIITALGMLVSAIAYLVYRRRKRNA